MWGPCLPSRGTNLRRSVYLTTLHRVGARYNSNRRDCGSNCSSSIVVEEGCCYCYYCGCRDGLSSIGKERILARVSHWHGESRRVGRCGDLVLLYFEFRIPAFQGNHRRARYITSTFSNRRDSGSSSIAIEGCCCCCCICRGGLASTRKKSGFSLEFLHIS